jgi:hypothetical protein
MDTIFFRRANMVPDVTLKVLPQPAHFQRFSSGRQ